MVASWMMGGDMGFLEGFEEGGGGVGAVRGVVLRRGS